MTTLTLELPPELYDRLRSEGLLANKPVELVAQELIAERLEAILAERLRERERAIEALRAAGLLTELGPEGKARAARSTATLEEVNAALARAGGKPLSELILEMRGPKE